MSDRSEKRIYHQAHQDRQGDHQDERLDEQRNDRRRLDLIAAQVVDAGLKVHRALGPGLLESAYEHCLAHECAVRGLSVARQTVLPIIYDGQQIDAGYRLDILVERLIIVEVKAVEGLTRLHVAQMLTYLKLAHLRLGLLMNFNVALFKDSVRRLIV